MRWPVRNRLRSSDGLWCASSSARWRPGEVNQQGLRVACHRAASLWVRACVGVATCAAVGAVSAQWNRPDPRQGLDATFEIAPFRLIDVTGHVSMHYLLDDSLSKQSHFGQAGELSARQRQSNLRIEPFVLTRSYIYHPNLLLLEVGGGPVLERGSFSSDELRTQSRQSQYNLQARATILREKPYRGSVFFEHLNPVQSVGPGQVMLIDSTRYGLDAALLESYSPMPLKLEANRTRTRGRTSEQAQDDRVDVIRVTTNARLGRLGKAHLQVLDTVQQSESGSLGLPIQATRSHSQSYGADADLLFGSERQFSLSSAAGLQRQQAVGGPAASIDQKDARFNIDLRSEHSKALSSAVRYHYADQSGVDQKTTMQGANGMVMYRPTQEWTISAGAKLDVARTTQMSSNQAGVDASVNLRQPLGPGEASAGLSITHGVSDQRAMQPMGRIIGEAITVADTGWVTLKRPQVTRGSVVVMNQTRTQVFVEGLDYVLSDVGLTTRLQRQVAGNILDGQEVLVDYSFDVGGTYASARTTEAINLGWSVKGMFNAYGRLSNETPRVLSGVPTFSRNPVRDALVGARLDWPAWAAMDLTVGAMAERQVHREVIAPYQRRLVEGYLQVGSPIGRGVIRLGFRRLHTAYSQSITQGVDASAIDLRLVSRLPGGANLEADAGRERDDGGDMIRERFHAALKLQWRLRRVQLSVDLGRMREKQGTVVRDHSRGSLTLRRDF